MTIKQARTILGKEAEGISNEEIQRDIEAAELLKNLFFEMIKRLNKPQQNCGNFLPDMP
jgi:hypothetical protein